MNTHGFGIGVLLGALLAAPQARAGRWLVRTPEGPAQTRSIGTRLEERGLRVLAQYRHVPWTAVEGSEATLQKLQSEGIVERFEPDLPRFLRDGAAARPAAFPWVVALTMLALWGCGGDDADEEPEGPAQTPSWGWHKIRVDQVSSRSTGQGVRVAVIDSGIDAEHPDLVVAGGRNFVLGAPSTGTREWDDCNGHGSHVAGIIAAQANEIGVRGIAPDVELYAARIFDCDGSGASISNILSAVDWVIDQKVQVANMSYGSSSESAAEREAMAAAEAAGIVLVAASGNGSLPGSPAPMDFPSAYPSVLGVGATDESDHLASFSSQGPQLGISAPGVNILSSVVKGSAVVATVAQGSQDYTAIGLTFSGTGTVEAKVYYCGLALSAADCPQGVRGNIALIERGQNFFSEKVTNAMAAGAAAAVIYNHRLEDGGLFTGTLQTEGTWIPTVSLSNADGLALRTKGDGTSAQVVVAAGDYDYYSGTSMASPHVAGVAALLVSIEKGLSPAQVRERLERGAVDLGVAGRDSSFGFGRLDAPGALGVAAKASAPAEAGREAPISGGLGRERLAL